MGAHLALEGEEGGGGGTPRPGRSSYAHLIAIATARPRILDVREAITKSGEVVRLLRVRNPHGCDICTVNSRPVETYRSGIPDAVSLKFRKSQVP